MGADATATSTPIVVRARTTVMSCSATVVATFDRHDTPPQDRECVVAAAVARLHDLERRWSRFLPDSEVSRLNSTPATTQRVSPDTYRLVEHLVRAWHATDGAFDPTLLGAIVHLGYGASRDRADLRTSLAPDTGWRGRPDSIRLDGSQRAVLLGDGTSIDPGGLGKGLAADIVVGELVDAGAAGGLVEIGGDLRACGLAPEGPGWPIAVDDRDDVVAVVDGGVATSTSRLRTWTTDGETRHHIVDPVTLRSTDTDAITCTVIAGTAAWAEALTKIAFARGAMRALDDFESRGVAASITTTDGVVETSNWQEFRR